VLLLPRPSKKMRATVAMTLDEYQQKAMVTKGKYNTPKDQIINALLGIAGESGEIHEMFKKHYSYGREIARDDLVKEIGDVLWYLAELCDAFDMSLEEVAVRNIEKLAARHGKSFSGFGNRSGAGK